MIFGFLSGAALARESTIAASAVPKPVLDAVAQRHPGAKSLRYAREEEHGQLRYEVELVDAGRRIDVELSPEGELLVEEETIAKEALPEPVRQALTKYSEWTLERIERVTKPKSDATFEVAMSRGGKRVERVFGADGRLTR